MSPTHAFFRAAAVIIPMLAAVAVPVRAETLRLPTGEVLIGRIVERGGTTLTFESKALGRLSIPEAGVEIIPDAAGTNAAQPAAATVPPSAGPGPGGQPERVSWVRQRLGLPPEFHGNLEFGAEVLNADARMRNYMLQASFGWKGKANEFETYHAYEKLTVNGIQATNTHDEGARWIRHLSPRWLLLSQADWRHDVEQGVRYRVDVVSIPAYYFIKRERLSLMAGVGPSYEWREWMLPGAEQVEQFNIATYQVFRAKFTPLLSLRQTFLGYVNPKESDDRRFVFDVSLRQQLTPGLSLVLGYNRRHDSQPAPRAVQDRDRIITKFGYEF